MSEQAGERVKVHALQCAEAGCDVSVDLYSTDGGRRVSLDGLEGWTMPDIRKGWFCPVHSTASQDDD